MVFFREKSIKILLTLFQFVSSTMNFKTRLHLEQETFRLVKYQQRHNQQCPTVLPAVFRKHNEPVTNYIYQSSWKILKHNICLQPYKYELLQNIKPKDKVPHFECWCDMAIHLSTDEMSVQKDFLRLHHCFAAMSTVLLLVVITVTVTSACYKRFLFLLQYSFG